MNSSYKNRVLCGSYLYMVHDALQQVADDAGSAGLYYRINHGQQDLTIRLFGFTDKLPSFLKVQDGCRSIFDCYQRR